MLNPGRWLSVARAHCFAPMLVATLSVVALDPSSGLACSCIGPSSPTAALEHATDVFSGRVTAVEDRYAAAIIKDSTDPVTIVFAVDRVWKGDVGPTANATTVRDGASCGFSFQDGESYLVYAYNSFVGLCSRTKLLASASEDLAELGPGRAPTIRTTEPGDHPTVVPAPTPSADPDVVENDVGYEECPVGTVPVEERLGGYLDLERLVGTYDRGCDECTVTWCRNQPRHGPFVSHYPDGRVHMRGFYKNGKRQGAWASWYPDGKKYYEAGWREDRKFGLWKLWRENGHPQAEMEYTDDVPDGRWILWHENGQLSIEGAYKRGERVGTWRIWDEDGTLRVEGQGGRDPASAR